MRIKLTLLAMFCFIKSWLFTQPTFNKTIDFSNGIDVGIGILSHDDGYILIGAGYGNEIGDFFDQKLKFAKTDLNGNMLWSNFIGESSVHLFCGNINGIITQDGKVVFCGSRLDSISYSTILVKFDPTTGDTIYYRRFDFDDILKGLQVLELSDGSLIILATDENDAFGSVLIKTSAFGDFIWQKRYGNSSESQATEFSINNDTIHLINRNQSCLPSGYKIRTIDSSGSLLQELFFDEDCPSNGFLSNQGGYYGLGAYFPVPPFQGFIYRTDSEGEIQWHYNTTFDFDTLEYKDVLPGVVKEMPNGDLVVAGYFASNYLGSYYGLVSKINLEGHPYWERIYTSTDDHFDDNMLFDFIIGPESEIVLVGSAYNNVPSEQQNFWLLKLDSLGCLVPGCDTLGINIVEIPTSESHILVYPNPVIDESIIQITGFTDVNSISISITDMSGKMIYQHSISEKNLVEDNNSIRFGFSRGRMQSGIYILSVYNENQLLGMHKIMLL